MADIPNRNTVFPTWAVIQENLDTHIATVGALVGGRDVGRAEVAARAAAGDPIVGVPANIGSETMPVIGLDVPVDLWTEHNTVNVYGSEYPEQITGSVPAGKTMNVNAGQRWLETSVTAGSPTFTKELPDDTIFINVAAGGTLNLNADKTHNAALTTGVKNPSTGKFEQYPLGGRNVLSVTGAGTLNADMGNYGNNLFVEAADATVKMGNGVGYYGAKGNSSVGHKVTGGSKADVFEYNFSSAGMPTNIGANTFAAGTGSREPGDADAIQLRNLPAGSKVVAEVSAVRGTGTFKDSDVTLTIKNAANTTIGTIAATNLNYVHMIYPDGSSQGFAPQTLGAGGSKTYTIGTTAPAAAQSSSLNGENLSAATRSLSSDSTAVNEPSVAPVNIAAPVPTAAPVKAK